MARYPFLELFEHDLVDAEGGSRVAVTLGLRDWCVIAATDEEHRWIVIEQHRHGVNASTWEPAGGIIEPGEPAADAALRELREESGYLGAKAELLAVVHPNPALSDNRAHLFLARGAHHVSEPDNPPDERTRVLLLSDDELEDALARGRISHALALCTLMLARQRLGSRP